MSNAVIRFDGSGRFSEPLYFSPVDTLGLDLIRTDAELVEDNALLTLALESSLPIRKGEWVIGYDGDTVTIRAEDVTSYALELAINRLAGLEGATVSPNGTGLYMVHFDSAADETFTLSHSILGSLTDRVETRNADRVAYFDLSVQKLAETDDFTAIPEATLTISTVAAGTSSVAQHQRLTLSRPPQMGKWRLNIPPLSATQFFRHDASQFEVFTGLNNISEQAIQVTQRLNGESIIWDFTNEEVGVSPVMTVSETLYGPDGLSCVLDLSDSVRLASLLSDGESLPPIKLALVNDGVTLFSQEVDMWTALLSTATPTIPA
jgi:hypothetical protein